MTTLSRSDNMQQTSTCSPNSRAPAAETGDAGAARESGIRMKSHNLKKLRAHCSRTLLEGMRRFRGEWWKPERRYAHTLCSMADFNRFSNSQGSFPGLESNVGEGALDIGSYDLSASSSVGGVK